MKRLLALALSALLACAPAWGQNAALIGVDNTKPAAAPITLNGFITPIMMTPTTGALPATANSQTGSSLLSSSGSGGSGTWFNPNGLGRQVPIPIPGAFFGLEATGPSLAMTGAGTANFGVATSGGTVSGNSPNCTLSAGVTSCSDKAGCAGGVASCANKLVVSGAPCSTAANIKYDVGSTLLAGTLTGPVSVSTAFKSQYANEGMIFGGSYAAVPTTIAGYLGVSLSSYQATEVNVSFVMPTAGTLDTMCVALLTGAPGAGASYIFTIFKNGVAVPSVTCTISGAAALTCNTAAGCSPSVACPGANVPVVAGDTISIQACPSNSLSCNAGTTAPTGRPVLWSMRWLPTTTGEAVIPATAQNASYPAASATTTYYNPLGGTGTSGTVQSAHISVIPYSPGGITFKFLTTAYCWTGAEAGRTFAMEGTNTPATLPTTPGPTSPLLTATTPACQTVGSTWPGGSLSRDTVNTFVASPVNDNTWMDTKAFNSAGTHQALTNFKQSIVAVAP